VQQRPADVAHSNDHELLELVLAKDPMELLAELVHLVSAAAVPGDAEQGKVLSYLGGRHSGGIGQVVREDPHEVQNLQPV